MTQPNYNALPARSMWASQRWLRRLIALTLALSLTSGAALGFWSAGSTPGGNGASTAASVDQGAIPTAISVGGDVTVSWAESTLSSGDSVSGYSIERYDASAGALQSVGAGCAGTIEALFCIEDAVPDGAWVYSVTPLLGTFWRGAESPNSLTVTTDSTLPVTAISATATYGTIYQSGNTIFYRGAASGSFTLTNAVSDSGFGPASSTTEPLGGTATGWSHEPSTVSIPSGGPYVSNPFTWTAATDSAPTEMVTGRDSAGNGVTTTLSFVDDSDAPTPGSISYPDGTQPDVSVVVAFSSGADSGSGIANRQLQRSSAQLNSGVCQSFTAFTNEGPSNPTSPYTDTNVVDGSCYQYRYVTADQLNNQDVATSTSIAKVVSCQECPNLGSADSYSVLAVTSVTSTGSTSLAGDLGVSPAGSISGFGPGQGSVAGSTHLNDASSAQAKADMDAAYANLDARMPGTAVAGDLSGNSFHNGIFYAAAAVTLATSVTLDAEGDPDAVFIFQMDAAFAAAASSEIVLLNGAQASNVFWQVAGAVSVGANASFKGTILGGAAVSLGADAQLFGRILTVGTVTLSSNPVTFTTATPPAVTIDGGTSTVTKLAQPTISGTTDAPEGTTVTVKVDGQELTTSAQNDLSWSVTTGPLTSGPYTVVAVVRDSASNAGSASQELTVEINPDPVVLGSADSYSVLAVTSVTSTGSTSLAGDLGVSPAGSISGFGPGQGSVAGSTHLNDASSAQAKADMDAAYANLDARMPGTAVAGDLSGNSFHNGIFYAAAAVTLATSVTLDAEGDPDAVFIFQMDAAFAAAASSEIVLLNGAQASNVFWQVAGAVSVGANASFKGTILGGAAVSLGADAQLFGRILTVGTVTLSSNPVTFTTATPPAVTIDGGTSTVTKLAQPTISGTTDAPEGTTVTVKVDGQELTTSAQNDLSWSVTTGPLTSGPYTVVAVVRDSASNAGSASQELTVEINPDPVVLGSADSYSVLAVTSVTSTGSTSLAGDLGVSPAGSISGFGPGQGSVAGSTHLNDASSAQAKADMDAAYANLDARMPGTAVAGDLSGNSFHNGIFYAAAAVTLATSVTLDAEGDPDAVFIFQMDAAFAAAASSEIVLLNGAQASNVFWQVAGAVSVGANASFKGTILGGAAVSLGADAQLFGRILTVGTVTLSSNPVTFN